MNSDPLGQNNDVSKVAKMARYSHPWRSNDGPETVDDLKQIVSDGFADHNIGGIGMFVMDEDGTPRLRMCVGLKKYTMDPSSMSSKLFGHWYCFVGDVEDGHGEINKFDWDCLQISSEINVYKEKHHKKILKENPTRIIIDPVGEDDAQQACSNPR